MVQKSIFHNEFISIFKNIFRGVPSFHHSSSLFVLFRLEAHYVLLKLESQNKQIAQNIQNLQPKAPMETLN
jgi:hypothetical protein